MKILSWNCRGLGNPRAIPILSELLRAQRPDVVFLYDTLVSSTRIDVVRSRVGFDNFFSVDCIGHSGGLSIFWRNKDDCSILSYSVNHIDLKINDSDRKVWCLTGFYGCPERNRRHESWNFLKSLATASSLSWVVVGDFNDLLTKTDKKGLHDHPDWCIRGFRGTVSSCGLIDIPMAGYPFTWVRHVGKPNEVQEHLDRALAIGAWLSLFLDCSFHNSFAPISDHSPVLLTTVEKGSYTYKRTFRFENKWIREPGLHEVVETCWSETVEASLVDRLHALSSCLLSWGCDLHASFRDEVKACRAQLERLRGCQSDRDVARFDELKDKLIKLLLQEEDHWRQRSMVFWLHEGDMNTRFFHSHANRRSKKNYIRRLKNSVDQWVSSEDDLCDVAVNYFTDLFSVSNGSVSNVIDLVQAKVSDVDNGMLLASFTKDEFKRALFQMHPDKAPGPDGFNPGFYQKFWPLLADSIYYAGVHWLTSGTFPPGLNDTVITLVPKCNEPATMKDLRPITLCNVVYKIIAKVLANRLKCVLPGVVSDTQSAFIKGRLIIDNVLVAFEVLHSM